MVRDVREAMIVSGSHLSEVTVQDLQEHALLPYTAARSQCLRRRYNQKHLSLVCGRAVYRLDQIRDYQYRVNLQLAEERHPEITFRATREVSVYVDVDE